MTRTIRLIVALTPDAARVVLRRRQHEGLNKSTIICRALAVYGAVAAAWDAGEDVVIVQMDGTRHRLVLDERGS